MQRKFRPTVTGGTLVVLAAALGLMSLASCTAKAPEGGSTSGTAATNAAMTPEQKIERGRYLMTIGSCNDCHTPGFLYNAPDSSRLLSGSDIGWVGPWGTSHAANLTPDMETGIGKWTEDDIVRAFRTGVKQDGSPVMPPMPWMNLAHMKDDDAYAIAAYLKSIPPVTHKVMATSPPGTKPGAHDIVFPPPPAWDAPRSAAAGGAPPAGAK
ncbi:MAG: c-type cytochrome [Candidatus Eisenbacteria bacterium]